MNIIVTPPRCAEFYRPRTLSHTSRKHHPIRMMCAPSLRSTLLTKKRPLVREGGQPEKATERGRFLFWIGPKLRKIRRTPYGGIFAPNDRRRGRVSDFEGKAVSRGFVAPTEDDGEVT